MAEKYLGLNKTQTREKLKEIKNKSYGTLSSQNFDFVIGAFQFLDSGHFSDKCNDREVESICVGSDQTGFGTKCYFLNFTNGESTDISIYGHRSIRADLVDAMRLAIEPTICEFKNTLHFPTKCPITGEVLTIHTADIDHYDMDFAQVADAFISLKGGAENLRSYITESKDNQTRARFTDDKIQQEWVEFHNSHTHLRAISRFANRVVRKHISQPLLF